MADPDLDQLAALKAEYERLDDARKQVKKQIVAAAVAAFRKNLEPAAIYERTPFSEVWLRAQVRKAGIPKAKPGTKPAYRPDAVQRLEDAQDGAAARDALARIAAGQTPITLAAALADLGLGHPPHGEGGQA